MIFTIVLVSVLSLVSAYSKCNTADVKGPIIIPITKVLSTSPIEINGNIEIVDGCTFKVTGFTFYNARSSKWYGGTGETGDAITLSDQLVNPSASNGSQTFKFRDVAGAQVSFRDFDQFRLFDEEAKVLVATAKVPSDVSASFAGKTAPDKQSSVSQASAMHALALITVGLIGYFLLY